MPQTTKYALVNRKVSEVSESEFGLTHNRKGGKASAHSNFWYNLLELQDKDGKS